MNRWSGCLLLVLACCGSVDPLRAQDDVSPATSELSEQEQAAAQEEAESAARLREAINENLIPERPGETQTDEHATGFGPGRAPGRGAQRPLRPVVGDMSVMTPDHCV